jgi:hypothetical protein
VLTDLLHAASIFVEWLATLGTGAVLHVPVQRGRDDLPLGLLVPGESVVMLAREPAT